MFIVIFEVLPKHDQWDAYLGFARLLRPDLERVDGFIDNVRYRSLRRPGWVLSLSTWRDEKALVRWRTVAVHHNVQARGREQVFQDYHLRVGQVTVDTGTPIVDGSPDHRRDATTVGAKRLSIVQACLPREVEPDAPEDIAAAFGLRMDMPGLIGWDVFDAILSPGDMLALASWQDTAAAAEPNAAAKGARHRSLLVVRDYGMTDRREAPQYFPPVAVRDTPYEVRKPPDVPG